MLSSSLLYAMDKFDKYSVILKAASAMQLYQRKLILGGAGIAITLILRHLFAKESKLIFDLSTIGQKTRQVPGSRDHNFDEYDIIIVGGGQ
jgi:hypothetical protein